MWENLGLGSGAVVLILGALYVIIKYAVKNGIKEAYTDITGKKIIDEDELDMEIGNSDDDN